MPFSAPYDSYYSDIFKPTLADNGYIVKRADDMFGPRPVMDDIRASILESDVLLCEMTGKNPNVFYELGLAHAIGKQVILVSQEKEDIPFDLRHVRVLLYDAKATGWSEKLRDNIRRALIELERDGHSWPLPLAPNAFPILDELQLLRKRGMTVQVLSSILDSARDGDEIFGSCNLCSDYPPEFYKSLPLALERGVKIHFVVKSSPDSRLSCLSVNWTNVIFEL